MVEDERSLSGFTIRVYGILMDRSKGILIADEFQDGKRFTKFPGGGLEHGEGTRDCLIREWKEELGQDIRVMDHFYTTDFFQRSAFNPSQQVISIYYLVKTLNEPPVKIAQIPFGYNREINGAESFRWVPPTDFDETLFTFPIDQLVGRMIMEKLQK